MKNIVLVFIVLYLAVSCSPKITSTNRTDSVTVSHVIEKADTSINWKMPAQSSIVSICDTISHIETDFAASDASFANGILTHSLRNKSDIPIPIIVPYYRETAVTSEKEVIIRNQVEYINIMKWWQEALMWAGIAGIILAVLMIALRMLKK